VRYTLQIRAADQLSATSQNEFTLEYDPKFGFEWINKDEVKLSWMKHPLKSLRQYKLTLFSDPYSYQDKTNSEDTTFIFQPHILFGNERSAMLEMIPYGELCYNVVRADTQIQLGNSFPQFYENTIAFNASSGKYFAIQKDSNWEDKLVRIGDTGVEQSYSLGSGQFALSPSGGFLYVASENVMKELDAMTFEVKQILNLSDLSGGELNKVWGNMTVSDNNILTIVTTRGSFVLDESFSILRKTISDPAISISPSGKYLFSSDSIFQWDGSQFQGKATQKLPDVFRSIFEDDGKVILAYYNTIGIFDLNTMSMESRTFFDGKIASITFDSESGLIGAFKESYNDGIATFSLYDRSANPLTTFTIANPDTHTGIYTLLINNHLICSRGTSLPLSYYYP
jgi:hypothetical protein